MVEARRGSVLYAVKNTQRDDISINKKYDIHNKHFKFTDLNQDMEDHFSLLIKRPR